MSNQFEERRHDWPKQVDPDFWIRLEGHMVKEEARERADAERLQAGDRRMEQIEKDLQPLKKMYWAVVGSGGVGLLLLAALLYIYQSDKANITAMQDVLYKQGTAIEKLIQSHTELEKDYRRDIDRIERDYQRSPK